LDIFVKGLVQYLKVYKYPVVASNIDASLEPELAPFIKKSTIVEREGKRIGIVGYVTRDYIVSMIFFYTLTCKIVNRLMCVLSSGKRREKEDKVGESQLFEPYPFRIKCAPGRIESET
jgi:5''-nucleotidase/2'',3''-cyclic phosphodiesterase and related esterases